MPSHTVLTVVLILFQIVVNVVLIASNVVLIVVLTISIAVEIIPLTVSHTVSTIVCIASQIFEKNVFIPSHALSQSPVKIPAIKSIRPPRASRTLSITSQITFAISINTVPILSRFSAMMGATFVINQLINGTNVCSQISFTASAIFPISSNALSIVG